MLKYIYCHVHWPNNYYAAPLWCSVGMDLPSKLNPELRKRCARYQDCHDNKDVEDLIESHAPDVMLSIITPKELNAYFKESGDLIRLRLKHLAYRFLAKHKLDPANTIAKICTTPYINLKDRYLRSSPSGGKSCVQCAVLAAAAALRRHWMIDSHYDKVNPHLELSKNRGVLDVEASRILWQHGVYNEELFILENVYDLLPNARALDLQSSVVDGPFRLMTSYYDRTLVEEPDWWHYTFRQLPYWDETTRPIADIFGRANYPKEFDNWLQQQSNAAHMSVYNRPSPYKHKLLSTIWNPPKPNLSTYNNDSLT